jgi:hypothetical protein
MRYSGNHWRSFVRHGNSTRVYTRAWESTSPHQKNCNDPVKKKRQIKEISIDRTNVQKLEMETFQFTTFLTLARIISFKFLSAKKGVGGPCDREEVPGFHKLIPVRLNQVNKPCIVFQIRKLSTIWCVPTSSSGEHHISFSSRQYWRARVQDR